MSTSYTTSFTVDQTPEEAFAAIMNVRGWWTGEIEGSTDKVGDEFTYRHPEIHYSKQKITELVPDKKVVWLVVDARLEFVKDKTEWINTEITFNIAKKGDQTEVRFTHTGLVAEYECFDACSTAWSYYVNGSLRTFITVQREKRTWKRLLCDSQLIRKVLAVGFRATSEHQRLNRVTLASVRSTI